MLVAAACSRAPVDPPHGPPQPSSYEAIELSGIPHAINDAGVVVGWRRSEMGRKRGFVYDNGVTRELPSAFEGYDNEAHAINRQGDVAGAEVSLHALLVWDDSTGPKRFDTGSEVRPETWVVGINETGDVLANVDDNHYNARGLIVHGGVQRDLGGLEENSALRPWTYARAWNARGQIVGSSRVRQAVAAVEVFHPFVWQDGVMRDLGFLAPYPCGDDPQVECSHGEARDINAAGVVIGSSTNGAGLPRAFIWHDGTMRDLGVFPEMATIGHAINDRGQVLGTFGDGWFIWENGAVRLLDSRVRFAFALGENGEVVGETVTATGDVHAFVWQDGIFTDLGPGRAYAVNARGDIIGRRDDYRGVLWRKLSNAPL